MAPGVGKKGEGRICTQIFGPVCRTALWELLEMSGWLPQAASQSCSLPHTALALHSWCVLWLLRHSSGWPDRGPNPSYSRSTLWSWTACKSQNFTFVGWIRKKKYWGRCTCAVLIITRSSCHTWKAALLFPSSITSHAVPWFLQKELSEIWTHQELVVVVKEALCISRKKKKKRLWIHCSSPKKKVKL